MYHHILTRLRNYLIQSIELCSLPAEHTRNASSSLSLRSFLVRDASTFPSDTHHEHDCSNRHSSPSLGWTPSPIPRLSSPAHDTLFTLHASRQHTTSSSRITPTSTLLTSHPTRRFSHHTQFNTPYTHLHQPDHYSSLQSAAWSTKASSSTSELTGSGVSNLQLHETTPDTHPLSNGRWYNRRIPSITSRSSIFAQPTILHLLCSSLSNLSSQWPTATDLTNVRAGEFDILKGSHLHSCPHSCLHTVFTLPSFLPPIAPVV